MAGYAATASHPQLSDPEQQVAIAKTSLVSSLMRRDPDPVPREDIEKLHAAVNVAIDKCSTENVQEVKKIIIKYATLSPGRVSAFGKFLAALSTALPALSAKDEAREERKPNYKTKRLFILYIVSDLLAHEKHKDQAPFQIMAVNIKPHIKALFSKAADVNPETHKSLISRLLDILAVWKHYEYFSDKYLDNLKTLIESGGKAKVDNSDDDLEEAVPSLRKMPPFTIPAMHGTEGVPWFHQPAGVMLHEMSLNPGRPIDPKNMKPLKYTPGPASENLANAMREFMNEVAKIGTTKDVEGTHAIDIDTLGRVTVKNQETRDCPPSESYYGWSQGFVQTISSYRGKKKFPSSKFEKFRRWDIPRTSSQSLSPSPARDRHRSNSHDRGRVGPRNALDETAGHSRPSPSPDRSHPSHSRSRSRSQSSISSQQRRYSRGSGGRSRSSSRPGSSRSRSPRPSRRNWMAEQLHEGKQSHSRQNDNYRRYGSQYDRSSRPGFHPSQQRPIEQGHQKRHGRSYLGHQNQPTLEEGAHSHPPHSMGMPTPPPRPPAWTGPWPPPPPPNMIPGQLAFPPFSGGPIPPQMYGNSHNTHNFPTPPPPPPPLPNMPSIPSQWSQPYNQQPRHGNQGGKNGNMYGSEYGGSYGGRSYNRNR